MYLKVLKTSWSVSEIVIAPKFEVLASLGQGYLVTTRTEKLDASLVVGLFRREVDCGLAWLFHLLGGKTKGLLTYWSWCQVAAAK
jgi:hypothetical protein